MKKILFLIFAVIIILSANLQADTTWEKTFGDSGTDQGYSITSTSDGGYILTGCTSFTISYPSNLWLIKTDAAGNQEWDKKFGFFDTYAYSAIQTSDGGYVAVGSTEVVVSDSDIFFTDVLLLKIDPDGHYDWSQEFGGSKDDVGLCVQQTLNGGFIISGWTVSYGTGYSDLWLIKTDPEGNEVWNNTYDFKYYDEGRYIQQTVDGGYIVTGYDGGYGSGSHKEVILLKTDFLGEQEWNKKFGTGGYDSEGYAVQQTSDGGYILVGYNEFTSYPYNYDIWVIKTDASGRPSWDYTFGTENDDIGYSIKQTVDGGYIVAGSKNVDIDYPPFSDATLLRLDSEGNLIWEQDFGGIASDHGRYVISTNDQEGFIFTGYTNSYGNGNDDLYLVYYQKCLDINEEYLLLSFPGNIEGCPPKDAYLYEAYNLCEAEILWSSSNPEIAEVDNNGHVIAKSIGEVTITAYCSDLPACKDECLVTVEECPSSYWLRTFGDEFANAGYSLTLASDGGYVITGYTEKFKNSEKVWLVKTNLYGFEVWNQFYGGSESDTKGFYVSCTKDGGYIITGSRKYKNEYSIPLIKTDAEGVYEWSIGIYVDIGSNEFGYCVRQTLDNNYIIAGETNLGFGSRNLFLIKRDEHGNVIWYRIYAYDGISAGYSVKETSEGGFIITGCNDYYSESSSLDLWLLKTDSEGYEEWSKFFDRGGDDLGYEIDLTDDGGYIITGITSSFDPVSNDLWLIKTDSFGNLEWSSIFGGDRDDCGRSVKQTSDSGFIVAGYTEISYENYDAYLLKTDAYGYEEWSKTYGGQLNDYGYSVAESIEGGYIMAGTTFSYGAGDSDLLLIYYKPEDQKTKITLN